MRLNTAGCSELNLEKEGMRERRKKSFKVFVGRREDTVSKSEDWNQHTCWDRGQASAGGPESPHEALGCDGWSKDGEMSPAGLHGGTGCSEQAVQNSGFPPF